MVRSEYSSSSIAPERRTNHQTEQRPLSSSLENKAKRHTNRNTDPSRDVDVLPFVRKSCNLAKTLAEYSASRGKEVAERDEFVGQTRSSENEVADDQADDTKNHSEYDEIPHAFLPLENVCRQLYHAAMAVSILEP